MATDGQRQWNKDPNCLPPQFHRPKLTAKQRDEILARVNEDGPGNSVQELALEFGITASYIRGLK